MPAIRRALLSVADRRGLVEFASALAAMGVDLLATGGTARALAAASVPVTPLETITGFAQLLDGRVKTLHPAVFAGILARDTPAHREQLAGVGASFIDLVAVTLYPFEDRAAGTALDEAVELIDVGGVALLRAAAKNWQRVVALCDPAQYGQVLDELRATGSVSEPTRRRLAAAAFTRTAAYDAAIAGFLDGEAPCPPRLVLAAEKVADLRYGENPHQRAAVYRLGSSGVPVGAARLQGKDLSYNNVVDLDTAWAVVRSFDRPAAAIVKHATPCGVAVADSPAAAYQLARAADPVSAFGGVVALNREVDAPTAAAVVEIFTEALIAPGYSPQARAALARRPHLRVVEAPPAAGGLEIRTVAGALLVQEPDAADVDEAALRVVTPHAPTPEQWADLRFAWTVCRWVKSNAIVLAQGAATVGIGSGQPSRVGAVELAVRMAGDRARGAVLASDGFFPFRDGVDAAARAGVTAIIQPGGSVRDAEVIAAAAEHGVAMVVTGIRHFRH